MMISLARNRRGEAAYKQLLIYVKISLTLKKLIVLMKFCVYRITPSLSDKRIDNPVIYVKCC